jgi:hypothetical protein
MLKYLEYTIHSTPISFILHRLLYACMFHVTTVVIISDEAMTIQPLPSIFMPIRFQFVVII